MPIPSFVVEPETRLPEGQGMRWRSTLAAVRSLVRDFGSLDLGDLDGLLGQGWGEAGAEGMLGALEAWGRVQEALGPEPGLVYMAGPFRGDGSRQAMDHNREHMAGLCRWAQAVLPGAALLVPHLNFSYVDEAGPGGARVREQVLRACETMVRSCRALILCGAALTPGMEREAEAARASGVPVFRVP